MASKKTAPRKTASIPKADLPEAGPATNPGAVPQNNNVAKAGFKTNGVPIRELDNNAGKDMSAEAVAARRSAAQKASQARRLPRTTTVHMRVKDIKVTTAKEGEETADALLRRIYSGRGEYVTKIGEATVQVQRSDLIRQLKALPPDAKSPLKMVKSATDDLVHILS